MSKQKRSGRAVLKSPCRLEELLFHAIRDMGRYADVAHLAGTLASSGVLGVKSVLSELLSDADLPVRDFQTYVVYRQIYSLLYKNVDLPGSNDAARRKASIKSFMASERRCKRTNSRLLHFRKHWSRAPMAAEIVNSAQMLISGLLPPLDTVYHEILDNATFGPGTTYGSSSYSERSLFYKVSGAQTATQRCRPYLMDYCVRNPRWFIDEEHQHNIIHYVEGGRVTFVPKMSDIFRTIEVQPSFNLFMQKGAEKLLARYLKNVGVTLTSQERNGELARLSSISGSHATLDLSAASDSISIELVRWLLPPDWFGFLDALRTESYTMDGGKTWTRSSKFSSMGNAFTFPVESLIFWALSQATLHYLGIREEIRIYGDDIITPVEASLLTVEVLNFCGFRVNTAKSFFFGSFRESCGYDYVAGMLCRPVFLKALPKSVTAVYGFHNRLLANDLALRFPNTLCYLQGLVDHAHYGPWHVARHEVGYWEEGFNPDVEAYFIGDPPDEKRWNEDTMSDTYSVQIIARRYKKLTGVSLATLYSLFLLGEDPRDIKDLGRPVDRQVTLKTSLWPTIASVFHAQERRISRGALTHASTKSVAESNRLTTRRIFGLVEKPKRGNVARWISVTTGVPVFDGC